MTRCDTGLRQTTKEAPKLLGSRSAGGATPETVGAICLAALRAARSATRVVHVRSDPKPDTAVVELRTSS